MSIVAENSTVWMLHSSLPQVSYKEDLHFDGWFTDVEEYKRSLRRFPSKPVEVKKPIIRCPPPVEVKKESTTIVKTLMCAFGIRCNRGEDCSFAHTVSELTPKECAFDLNCEKGDKCPYKHSNENKTEYVDRITEKEKGYKKTKNNFKNAAAADKPKGEESSNNNNTRSVMCMYARKCRNSKCTYAHNLSELSPIMCQYREKCRRGVSCRYMHSNETKQVYVDRIASQRK